MEVGSDVLKNLSQEFSKTKSDANVVIVNNQVTSPLLMPITPDSNKEIGDFPFHLKSPLTCITSPPKGFCCFETQIENDPCSSNDHSLGTPKEGVFDPFAPATDKLMMARKTLDESQSSVVRRLNFGSFAKFGRIVNCAENMSDDEMLLQDVYDSLLEAIISKHTEAFLDEVSSHDPSSECDGFRTPSNAPRLIGMAETCPDAPMKNPARSRSNTDSSFCRKLKF